MDQANLQAFVSVCELKSFSHAAEALFITQPAISKRIQQLELELHCKLIDRHGKTITLTQSGQAMLPKAKKILFEMDDCKQLAADLRHEAFSKMGNKNH